MNIPVLRKNYVRPVNWALWIIKTVVEIAHFIESQHLPVVRQEVPGDRSALAPNGGRTGAVPACATARQSLPCPVVSRPGGVSRRCFMSAPCEHAIGEVGTKTGSAAICTSVIAFSRLTDPSPAMVFGDRSVGLGPPSCLVVSEPGGALQNSLGRENAYRVGRR